MKEREWEKGSHRSSFQTTLSPLPPPPPPPPLRLHIHLWVCSWFNCLVRIEQIECALPDPAELTGGITGLIWRERKGGRAKKGGGERYTGREEETESDKSKRRQQRRKRVSLVFRAESARNRLLDPIYFSLLFFLLFLQSFAFNLAPSFSVVSWIASYYLPIFFFAPPSTSFSLNPVFPNRLSGFSTSLSPHAQVECFCEVPAELPGQ